MRSISQRVLSASVTVDGKVIGQCDQGLLLLVGIHNDDTPVVVKKMAEKVAGLRIFNDPDGKMNLSLQDFDPNLEILAISNFTVYGDARKQRRPSFMNSAPFELGKSLFEEFIEQLRALDIRVDTGEFGADMKVSLVNDGPVTIVLDVDAPKNLG